MTDLSTLNTERLRWARIHPAAAYLADSIGNLAQREGWQPTIRTNEEIDSLHREAQAMADRCAKANVPRISSGGDVLPSWAMVAQLLSIWRAHGASTDRHAAASRTTTEAYEACHYTATGRLNGVPWPV